MRILFFCWLVQISGIYCAALFSTLEENSINDTETINKEDEAAPCLVSDILYNHGQQIERQNECDYCICVDGDMFCYWQCSTRQLPSTNSVVITARTDPTPVQVADAENFTTVLFEKTAQNNTLAASESEMTDVGSNLTTTSAQANSTTIKSTTNQTCVVTGTEYLEGDVLPQEDGSCLQCVCGQNGRVTCAPQGCVSLQQDRFSQGLESNSLDMFDVDVF